MHKLYIILVALFFVMPAAAAENEFIGPGVDGLPIPPNPVKLNVTPRTIDLLNDQLKKQTGPSRVELVHDLGQCAAPALKYLTAALADADPLVRAEAARSIGNIKDVSALSSLKPLLSDSSAVARREAVLAAAQLGGQDDVTTALNDSADEVQIVALRSASTPAQGQIIANRFDKYSKRLQPLAAAALGRIGSVEGANVVLPLLKSPDPLSRAAGISALGGMKAVAQTDQVVAALGDSHPTVRRAAIAALGRVAPVELQQSSAIHALEDPDPTVRQSASILLQAVPTPTALPALFHQLSTDYVPLHDAARLAIVKVGAPAIPPGAQLLDDPEARRREDGSFILGQLSSNEKIGRHIALLADADFGVAEQAAKSMYRIAPPAADAGPQLLDLINRAEGAGRVDAGAAAILAAGRIRYAPIIERSLPLLPVPPPRSTWPPPDWRTAGAWAIGMTAKPHSAALGKMRAIITSKSQGGAMVFEAIKAMYNANDVESAPLLKNWESDLPISRDSNARWLAHDIYDRFSGTHTDYTLPTPTLITPELSIVDTTGH